ncbi:MAG: LPXTG cell wall anchor domain-containing protein [Porcipelethomonas sp.]
MNLLNIIAAVSPKTGDERNVVIYIVVAAVAALLMAGFFILSHKSKK